MRLTARRLLSASVVVAALSALAACTRTSDGEAITKPKDTEKPAPDAMVEGPKAAKKKGVVPERHREAAVACSTDKVKGDAEPRAADAGAKPSWGRTPECAKDADCTAGKNGRCSIAGGGRMPPYAQCIYDGCYADADCGKKSACICGSGAASGHYCMSGNCATDADCGASYCSPSLGSCGGYGGYVGNYCHGADDECTNDADCKSKDGGYCAWSEEVNHWRCSYNHCVG
jgi:hypothetical protein